MSLSSEAKKHLHESLQQQCLNQKSAKYNKTKRLFMGLTDLDYKPGHKEHTFYKYWLASNGHTSSSDRNDTALLDAYQPKEIYSQIPDTHECVDGNQPLRLIIDIDARQKSDPTNPKGFTEKVIELVGEPYSKFIDNGLPKTHFNLRLLGSAKEGRIKRLAIYSVKTGFNNLDNYLVQPKKNYSVIWSRTFSSEEPVKQESQPINDENALSRGANLVIEKYRWLQIGKFGNGFINFQAQPILCRPEGHFILKCYWQKQYKPEHKSISFDKVSNKVESKEKPKWGLIERIVKAIKHPHPLPQLPGEVINVKKIENAPEAYLDFLSEEHTTILIRSPVASGKTKTLREILDSLAKSEANLPCLTGFHIENEGNLAIRDWNVIIVQVESTYRFNFHGGRSHIVILDESAVHVVAMDAFANKSTLVFLRQYQNENIQVFDNRYQPRKSETIKIFYNSNKGSEAIRKGLEMLKEGKRVVFLMTSCKKAQAIANQASKLQKPNGSFILSRVYFSQMDGNNAKMTLLILILPGVALIAKTHSEIFKEPNRDLIRAELSALRPEDSPTAIKGCSVETYIEVEYQRRLSAKYFSEILCSLIASTEASLELITVEDTKLAKASRTEVSHTIKKIEEKIKSSDAELIVNAPDINPNKAEMLKLNPERSFIDNITLQHYYLWRTYASGDIGDFVKRYNNPEPLQHFRRLAYFRKQGSNAINSIENPEVKKEMQWEDSHKSMDPSLVDLHKFYSVKQWKAIHILVQSIGLSDIDDTNILSGDDVAKGTPDLKATIKLINAIVENWCGYTVKNNESSFETIERIMTIKSNDPNYQPKNPVLLPYKPESVDETQELFDSKPITIDIVSDEICKESSCNNIAETQNQSNISKQSSSITETKIEIPESLSSLSSEFLIKNESDINILIFYLHEKFDMSQERLEKWKNNILFEMQDNYNYWKKEHESMGEVTFLEYKRNFEAKMKVPTTPYKKELKTRSLALIEYAPWLPSRIEAFGQVVSSDTDKSKEPGKWKPIWKVPSKEVATIFDSATRTRISETEAGELDDMTFGGEGPPTWPPESYRRKRTYVLELGTRGRKTIVAPNAG
ncbi:hypothetical protein C2G38_2203417 [Gigaspora rosea]|uniref:Replication origin-binding protein domain-containing protein n=1 Tax=Gigaspora rosea TaxID=44941 RepID=A0A397URM7_9GLOM|nr:hypothetical protein C2G38_2203417 [Gigaspora rosea]